MDYLPTNLPRYVKINKKLDFANSIIKPGYTLLFSLDGLTLSAKTSDSLFVQVGGGAVGEAYVIVLESDGSLKAQKLSFEGTQASLLSDSLSISGVALFNTGMLEPAYDGKGGETSFYKCASVDTAAGTWTGYKWVFNEEEGIYELETELTSDPLTMEGFTPSVGKTYSGNTRESADMWEGSLGVGLVFYAPLTDTSTTAETGQTLNFSGDVTATTMNGVPCLYSSEAYITSAFTTPTTFTVCFWCKPETQPAFGVGGTDLTNGVKSLAVSPTYVSTMEEYVSVINNKVPVSANSMDFYAWSYTNGSQTLWKNNEVIATSTYNESNTNNSGICIRIQGWVSAGRIYNRFLTADEITELANEFTPDYTEFYLNKSLTDSSPNAIPVTNHGLTVSETGIMCTENGYAEIAANALPESVFVANKPWTFEMKFRNKNVTPLSSTYSCLFGRNTEDNNRFDMLINNEKLLVTMSYGQTPIDVTSLGDFSTSEWHKIKITQDASNNYTVFLDDSSIGSGNWGERNRRTYAYGIGSDMGFEYGVRYGYPFEIEYIKISSAIV